MLYCSRGDKITVCAQKMYPVASVALLVALPHKSPLSNITGLIASQMSS